MDCLDDYVPLRLPMRELPIRHSSEVVGEFDLSSVFASLRRIRSIDIHLVVRLPQLVLEVFLQFLESRFFLCLRCRISRLFECRAHLLDPGHARLGVFECYPSCGTTSFYRWCFTVVWYGIVVPSSCVVFVAVRVKSARSTSRIHRHVPLDLPRHLLQVVGVPLELLIAHLGEVVR